MESWEVIERAVKLVQDYTSAMEETRPVQNEASGGSRSWRTPEPGVFKVNFDAEVFGDGKMGLGGIVRDELGER